MERSKKKLSLDIAQSNYLNLLNLICKFMYSVFFKKVNSFLALLNTLYTINP